MNIEVKEVDREDDEEEEDKDGGSPKAANEPPGGVAEGSEMLELGQLDEEMVKRAIQMKPRSFSFVFPGAATVAPQSNTQRASLH